MGFGLDIISGIVGSAISGFSSRQAADKNRDFQASMSNTAYQRATKDMIAAGLNPGLAYSQGGASVPSGAVADVPDYGSSAIGGANAASTAKMADIAVDRGRADIGLTHAQREYTLANARLARVEAEMAEKLGVGARLGLEYGEKAALATGATAKATYSKVKDFIKTKREKLEAFTGGDYMKYIKDKFNLK